MSTHEDLCDRLDSEFDNFLSDMKPYVLKHPNKSERQQCAIWIKKLCDPTTCGSGLMGRKNRNMYARLLLQMLKRGVLELPFTVTPEPGILKTLPTYMSIYFDEPLPGQSVEQDNAGLPDWLTGELGGNVDDSLTVGLHKERTSSTPIAGHHRRKLFDEKSSSKPSPIKQAPRHSEIFNSGFGKYSGALTDDRQPQFEQNKETELKLQFMEEHEEEKLKMQQKHNVAVRKILDRKNGEIEEIKSMYRAKQKESEEMIFKLERKVQNVVWESQVICESKEKQIAELKKMLERSAESLRNEWEKKLQDAVTEIQREKFDLQKKHLEDIQELHEDSNHRLAKMEAEYNAQSQTTAKEQAAEVEKSNVLREKLTQEKAQLEIHIASLSVELQEAKRRNMTLQKEKDQQREQHEQNVQKLSAKHETDISHLFQEHALSVAKYSEVIGDFEKVATELKQQLLDNEHQSLQQLRLQEVKFQQEKEDLLTSYEKQVFTINHEAEKERKEAKMKISKLEDTLREKESQLDRTRESQRQQMQQADMMLEHFKKQMKKVEEDLNRSKTLREKQAKEFSKTLDALRQKYEQQMTEQRMQHEQERTRLQQQHSAEKDSLVQEHQQEVNSLERQAMATLQQHQQQTQDWRKHDAQRISNLEVQLASVKVELQRARTQHKQQLAEMAVDLEEEKQKAFLDKEASLTRLRSEMERIHAELERSHQREKVASQEKSNCRLKQIEKEYSQKLAKSAQLIAELQRSLCDSKEEVVRMQRTTEKRLEEANARWDEKRTKSQKADQANKEKVESLQRQLHNSEKKLFSKELETEEKVTGVRREYEEKIKGLMPAELRQELEDTIASLKAQVNFLRKRATLLQEELDACRSRR